MDSTKANNSYEKALEKLECPFTWMMDDVDQSLHIEYTPHDDEESFPIRQLMRNIMMLYVDTKAGESVEKVWTTLGRCSENLVELEERAHPQISIKAARYVFEATKCFVLSSYKLDARLKRLLEMLPVIDVCNKIETSTLKACRSLAWSLYHRVGAAEAVKFIREAIDDNPNCDLWYFVLGKNLRRLRRDSTVQSTPDPDELTCFKKAYQMSKNPIYGTFLAQVYRESREIRKAKQLYQQIYATNPRHSTILLRLALGLMQYRDFDRAKDCLDRVAERYPDKSMYLHYRGIWYMKQNDFKEAAYYLKKASEDDNFPADKQYFICMLNVDPSFDTVGYLHDVLKKYKTLPEEQIQSTVLDLAACYWKKKNDLKQAVKYFLHAIEINPEARCLTDYYHTRVTPIKEKNIYQVIERDLLPIVFKRKIDVETIEMANDLEDYCEKYFEGERSCVEMLSGMKLNK